MDDVNKLIALCLLILSRGWIVTLFKALFGTGAHQRHREWLTTLPTWLDWLLYALACMTVIRFWEWSSPATIKEILQAWNG